MVLYSILAKLLSADVGDRPNELPSNSFVRFCVMKVHFQLQKAKEPKLGVV